MENKIKYQNLEEGSDSQDYQSSDSDSRIIPVLKRAGSLATIIAASAIAISVFSGCLPRRIRPRYRTYIRPRTHYRITPRRHYIRPRHHARPRPTRRPRRSYHKR